MLLNNSLTVLLVGLPSRHVLESKPIRQRLRTPSELIELWLSRGRNAKAIWQDLVDDYGFTDRYQSVKRFIRKLRGKPAAEARAVIETAPSEEAPVDYGAGPMVLDLKVKYRRT